jgi:hypothetical protein
MSQRLNHLRTEFSKITKGIDDIEAAAKARGGDLTDAEAADVDKLYARSRRSSGRERLRSSLRRKAPPHRRA